MKKDLILFGSGLYGEIAYQKLSIDYNIICFVDNNKEIQNTKKHNLFVLSIVDALRLYNDSTSIVVCVSDYLNVGKQLYESGIVSYYVMIDGFLFKCDANGTMRQEEICKKPPIVRYGDDKIILFVQTNPCIRTLKISSMLKKRGFKVYLLYTHVVENQDFKSVYDDTFLFSSVRGIQEFVKNSDIDTIHSSNEPDYLTNTVIGIGVPVVHDCHDLGSEFHRMSFIETMIENNCNVLSNGVIYTTEGIRQEAIKKYRIPYEKTFVFGNMISEELRPTEKKDKLSRQDGELHCVYEGGVWSDENSHRFFEEIWRDIAESGVHVHFFSQGDPDYCRKIEEIHPRIHYEGNLSSKELANELSQYDVGLLVLKESGFDKCYMEWSSPNKLQEYINAGIPVAVGTIDSHISFVENYGFGKQLDMSGDIYEQLKCISEIYIEEDALKKNGLTMESCLDGLISFYDDCIRRSEELKR